MQPNKKSQPFNEVSHYVELLDFTKKEIKNSKKLIEKHKGSLEIKKVMWFIPNFDHIFRGGIYTIFRFASYLKEQKGVRNSFVIIYGEANKEKIAENMANAFPPLKNEEIFVFDTATELNKLDDVDATICTLWTTAYYSLRFNKTKRKFYFIQDFESLFYPAGSMYGLCDMTYRFGFYGLTNTVTLTNIYEQEYNGCAEFFTPCIDTHIFYPGNQDKKSATSTVFFYGRPSEPRNGFELGAAALRKLKAKMGNKVRIVAAGAEWDPADFGLEGVVECLGLLSYEETAALYRTCDAGLVMMFTRHPSYLPMELMASGCLVITNFNPANTWLLHDRVNCLLSPPSASSLCDTLEEGLNNIGQRKEIIRNALATVEKHSDWNKEFEKIYSFMCNPENKHKKNSYSSQELPSTQESSTLQLGATKSKIIQRLRKLWKILLAK